MEGLAEVITAIQAFLPAWAWTALLVGFVLLNLVNAALNGVEREARRQRKRVPGWFRIALAALNACAFSWDKAIELLKLARS